MILKGVRAVSVLSMLLSFASLEAESVMVAVSANFTSTMKELAPLFQKKTGYRIQMSSGATGAFYAQIKNGAPFEILLAADDVIPEKLIDEGLATPGSRFTYAIGRLVLWSTREGFVDSEGRVLSEGNFRFLAIANAGVAPYGRAAETVLTGKGLLETLQSKIVRGESITQTYQFVAAGNAELGFVALSQIIDSDGRLKSGSCWIVPADMMPPLRQEAVLLTKGERNRAASALLEFMKTGEAREVIRRHGYDTVPSGLP